jgi:hypothetical protein
MSDMNANDVRSINQRLFEQIARFECEASVGTGRYVPCGKPATEVIEWRHQDGDDEQRLLCAEHAFAEVWYWSMMDWDTDVKAAHIIGPRSLLSRADGDSCSKMLSDSGIKEGK